MLNNDQDCQTVELTIHQHQHAKQHPAPPVGGKARQSHPLYPKCRVNIKGIGGTNPITEMCTVCGSIEDDQGKLHEIIIPGTYYNPKSPYRLLSPQQLQPWIKVGKRIKLNNLSIAKLLSCQKDYHHMTRQWIAMHP